MLTKVRTIVFAIWRYSVCFLLKSAFEMHCVQESYIHVEMYDLGQFSSCLWCKAKVIGLLYSVP